MQLGRHLRELWGFRAGLAVSLALGLVAALWSVGSIGLFPPQIKPRKLEMAAASTRLLVDTPKSTVLDLGVNTNDIQSLKNRALLISNIMASAPVRAYIARRAQVPASEIQVASPVTPDFPRQLASTSTPRTSDIAKSPAQYRLSIQSNPTVPIVDVYAQAPTTKSAEALANGAVDGMRDYLRDLSAQQSIPASKRVNLEQFGRADGGVLNRGVELKLAVLSFLVVFVLSIMSVGFIGRVRRGWALQAAAERSQAWAPAAPPKGS